ncbi:MAG: hypothetical protein KA314_04625 [Chloroflexi bacterium]|nr:hypothetical protein [Chloroflexota bacterium]
MNNEQELKSRARRVLRALNNLRVGRWREFMMSPQDRLDAAWLVHRYQELKRTCGFSEAHMVAGTEFLLMVIRGDDRIISQWGETRPLSWCLHCQSYRLAPAGSKCPAEGCRETLIEDDLVGQWEQHWAWVLRNLVAGKVDRFAAAGQLSVDDETLREWVLDEYFSSQMDQPAACRILGLTAEELIATRVKGLMPAMAVDDLPPIDLGEALQTLRRVARIEE